jgi:CheY-like chemotaxis protein
LALTPLTFAKGRPSTPPKTPASQSAEIGVPVLEGPSYKEFNAYGQVWASLQDQRGVMYFGISGGELLEYDGVSWRKIVTPGSNTRSLAIDSSGKIWLGCNAGFGYLAPDSTGTMHFVSLLENVPENDRDFTDVWQTLVTPQGIFFRSYELLFRWDGKAMHVWRPSAHGRFQALSMVRIVLLTAKGQEFDRQRGHEVGADLYMTKPFDPDALIAKARSVLGLPTSGV